MRSVRNQSYRVFMKKTIILLLLMAVCILLFSAAAALAQNEAGLDPKKQDKADQVKSDQSTPDQTKSNENEEELYIIGNTDKVSITFWQQPDLNREIRVNENGMISLPVIGEIKAAGLTTAELSKRIIQQMSLYNTPVSQATVTVTEFNSRSVVVSGSVHTPGTYKYERIPDVWQVILDAGGPSSDADLSQVTIVRKEGEKSKVINVDLYSIIKSGDLSKAPQLSPGDLVNVPQSSYGTNMNISSEPKFQGRNIVFVFGQVTEQGPRNLEDGMDVLDAIAVAKGFTNDADLKNVRVIMKDAKFSNVVKINLEQYTKTGRPPRMMLHPEDTIIVPKKRSGTFGSALSVLNTVVPLLGAMGTLVLLTRRNGA
jgi:polysaccharide biosynthesis/export protein